MDRDSSCDSRPIRDGDPVLVTELVDRLAEAPRQRRFAVGIAFGGVKVRTTCNVDPDNVAPGQRLPCRSRPEREGRFREAHKHVAHCRYMDNTHAQLSAAGARSSDGGPFADAERRRLARDFVDARTAEQRALIGDGATVGRHDDGDRLARATSRRRRDLRGSFCYLDAKSRQRNR